MESPSSEAEQKMTIKEPLLISNPQPQKGGFRTLPFIMANEAFERLASFGLMPNMILYLTREYGLEASRAATVLFFWSAFTNFMPILGAFLADSYVGRFRMIGSGSVISLLGTSLLWLTTMIPQARPSPCTQTNDACESASASQLLLLFSSFGLISIGAGGIRSSALAFGAEQLGNKDDLNDAGLLESFMSWYYCIVMVCTIVAMTCIVYIQEVMGWKVGFGVPMVLMILSVISFFSASPFYVKSKPNASLLTGFAQVLVASYKKSSVGLPAQAQPSSDELYYHGKGTTFLVPTDNLRFFNKACIITNPEEDLTPDGKASDPWNLCTTDQVEELKALIKVIPIWSSGILTAVNISQNSQVLQLSAMDRHITSKFEVPAGSFTSFLVLSLTITVAIYDRAIIPLASKIKGKPTRLSLKQRMGIGILFSSSAMAAFAIVESVRRENAIRSGFSDDPEAVVDMSAMWFMPYYVLSGVAEAFSVIGQNQFYYTELPRTMSSVAATLFAMGLSAANLLASLIMNAVDAFTRSGGAKGGEESWVSSNINKGHYDYYYWLLSGLSLVNFMYYLFCSKAYGPSKEEGDRNVRGEERLL